MAVDPTTLSAAAETVNAATPFVANALKGLFGVTSAEEEERRRILESMAPYMRVAQGGTTQGQAGLSYARGRAAQELQGQAARGTAQQQAGLQREAMRVGQDIGTQYASQLADLRAVEQERAAMGVARGQELLAKSAREEAARKRQELAGFAKAVGGKIASSLVTKPGGEKPGGETLSPDEARAYNEANTKYSQEFAGFMGRDKAPAAKARLRMAGATVNQAPAGATVRDVGETGAAMPAVDSLASKVSAATPPAESLAQSAFVAPEPPAKSIYGGMDLGSLGAASGPDMAPAPIAMRGFGSYLSPGRAPVPQLAPGSNVTPTRSKAIVAPRQRKAPINLGDTFIDEVDSPEFLTGRRPAKLRTR